MNKTRVTQLLSRYLGVLMTGLCVWFKVQPNQSDVASLALPLATGIVAAICFLLDHMLHRMGLDEALSALKDGLTGGGDGGSGTPPPVTSLLLLAILPIALAALPGCGGQMVPGGGTHYTLKKESTGAYKVDIVRDGNQESVAASTLVLPDGSWWSVRGVKQDQTAIAPYQERASETAVVAMTNLAGPLIARATGGSFTPMQVPAPAPTSGGQPAAGSSAALPTPTTPPAAGLLAGATEDAALRARIAACPVMTADQKNTANELLDLAAGKTAPPTVTGAGPAPGQPPAPLPPTGQPGGQPAMLTPTSQPEAPGAIVSPR